MGAKPVAAVKAEKKSPKRVLPAARAGKASATPSKLSKTSAKRVQKALAPGSARAGKAKAETGTADEKEPYPKHARPSEEECLNAVLALASMHGLPSVKHKVKQEGQTVLEGCGGQDTCLDSLVKTILSQNTTDVQSHKGFVLLKSKYPDWESVRLAPAADIEAAIKSCGLAEIKTRRIHDILNTLHAERGECSLEYIRVMTEAAVKDELRRFNGVGPKTIACVLMFTLNRPEFPVDTHVWRISKNQGWVPASATRETTYAHMNTRVPDKLKYDLHCLLVEHGKRCLSCAKNGRPRFEVLGPCPLKAVKLNKTKLAQFKEYASLKQDTTATL